MFFLFILFEIFVIYMLYNFKYTNVQYTFENTLSSINFFNDPDPCKNIIIKCNNQKDCEKCLNNKYSCEDGFCIKKKSSKIICDETKGMYPILIKSDGKDVYKCMSIFPLYFDNFGNKHEYVCKNGTTNTMYSLNIDDRICVCDRLSYEKISIHNIPTCVKNKKLYKY